MSVHQATLQALIEMGIHAPLARAAAQRFENADAAVNWCFGDGANWTPEDEAKRSRPVPPPPSHPPPPDITVPGTTVEHREVAQTQSDTSSTHTLHDVRSPPLPPRTRPLPSPGRQSPLPLGDKNPFRNSLKLDTNNPFAPAPPPSQSSVSPAQEEDAELQRALALSRGQDMDVDTTNDADNEEEKWDLEARKVRTSGPPPSPTLQAQDGVDSTTFGPTNKTDHDGSMAVAPYDWDKFPEQSTSPQRSKEDEEMEKAIADSLMTASFHSAASAPREEDLPRQVSREAGTPLVLYSPSGQTASSSLLQGLLAIPRFREVVMSAQLPISSDSGKALERLRRIASASDDMDSSYFDVDSYIKELDPKKSGKELPPINPTRDLAVRLHDIMETALSRHEDHNLIDSQAENQPHPLELFASEISTSPMPATYVTFFRDQQPFNIHAQMARVLWNEESYGTIHQLPDILTVYLGWHSSAKREVWKLDKEVVMDRYLTKNAAWAVHVRAMQSVAEGKARRLKEKIESLTKHNGDDIATTMINTIKYYEAYAGKDDVESQHRSELKTKLQQVHDKLQLKVAELKEELDAVDDEVNGSLFDTDEPKLNEHIYRLRTVLYHDGALLGTRHLYMYLLGEGDQWWKIQEHEAIKVDWSDVASDSTGMYMDGGAYCLLYERVTPRLEPYGPHTGGQQTPQDQNMSRSENETQVTDGSASQVSTLVPSAPPESGLHPIDDASIPSPSAPPQIDVLGDEPGSTDVSTPKPRIPEHRPLPRPPVQTIHPDEKKADDTKTDDDVTMT